MYSSVLNTEEFNSSEHKHKFVSKISGSPHMENILTVPTFLRELYSHFQVICCQNISIYFSFISFLYGYNSYEVKPGIFEVLTFMLTRLFLSMLTCHLNMGRCIISDSEGVHHIYDAINLSLLQTVGESLQYNMVA